MKDSSGTNHKPGKQGLAHNICDMVTAALLTHSAIAKQSSRIRPNSPFMHFNKDGGKADKGIFRTHFFHNKHVL